MNERFTLRVPFFFGEFSVVVMGVAVLTTSHWHAAVLTTKIGREPPVASSGEIAVRSLSRESTSCYWEEMRGIINDVPGNDRKKWRSLRNVLSRAQGESQ